MKKTYEKPRLAYESFALSNSISSGCEAISNQLENQCPVIPKDWYDAGLTDTIYAIDFICEETGVEYTNLFCYYAPSDNNNIFSS